jgi:bifunctional DNA-binding transcriptional regulator/antitoxin component of YhaV-PrlF toxin-antitoxin module
MRNLAIGRHGEIALPQDLRTRYRLESDTPVRVIETATSVILVPITDAPMSDELRRELEEWQSLAAQSWNDFPYDPGTAQ